MSALPADAIKEAFAEAFGSAAGERLAAALADTQGDGINLGALGEALANALAPEAPFAAELPLSAVKFEASSGDVLLTPEQAATHPLLAGWCPSTFGGALAAPLKAAALAHNDADSCPLWSTLDLVQAPGEPLWASSFLRVKGLLVALHYGRVSGPHGVVSRRTICSDHLFQVGLAIRPALIEQASRGVDDLDVRAEWRAWGSFFSETQPASGVRH